MLLGGKGPGEPAPWAVRGPPGMFFENLARPSWSVFLYFCRAGGQVMIITLPGVEAENAQPQSYGQENGDDDDPENPVFLTRLFTDLDGSPPKQKANGARPEQHPYDAKYSFYRVHVLFIF